MDRDQVKSAATCAKCGGDLSGVEFCPDGNCPSQSAATERVFAGRFVLLYDGPTGFGRGYVTSWDSWEEAEAAWPIEAGYRVEDGETGRVWRAGFPYEWEAAQT